jgi:hypothetical protein
MGEVYRVRDTVLKRDAAIKVLPEFWSRDPGALAPKFNDMLPVSRPFRKAARRTRGSGCSRPRTIRSPRQTHCSLPGW